MGYPGLPDAAYFLCSPMEAVESYKVGPLVENQLECLMVFKNIVKRRPLVLAGKQFFS